MTRGRRLPWARARLLVAVFALACLAGAPGGVHAGSPPVYHPAALDDQGTIGPAQLEHLRAAVRAELPGPAGEIVVMVHGFNTSASAGQGEYAAIAARLRAAGRRTGLRIVPVGVHWPSHPGPILKWLPRVIAYRLTSELGFPRVIRNPYLQKVRQARQAGERGLRDILLGLGDERPGAAVHVLAHSLGGELVVRALAPGRNRGPRVPAPERALNLGLVALAGADLDHDAFLPANESAARDALPRARVWWVTVPREGLADAVLELRRGAGRRDAVGNRGLALEREDFTGLMARRGLVLDDESVPIRHRIEDYYDGDRVRSLALSMLYLRDPSAPAAAACLLGRMDRILARGGHAGGPAALGACDRLYLRWQSNPTARRYRFVEIRDRPSHARAGKV